MARRRAVLTVADTGAGIPEEVRERIFDDFFTTKGEGAGLGLSIVRRLVADLRGLGAGGERAGEGEPVHGAAPAAGTGA